MRKLLLVVLMLCLSGLISADNHNETVFCGDLSAEDCAILIASSEAMAGLTGASAEFALDLSVTGMSGDMSDLSLSLTGAGTYSGVDMMAMGAMAEDMDMMSVLTTAGEAIAGFNGELNLTLSLPADLAGPDAPESITLDLRLVDGVGYINFDSLSGLGLPAELSGWGGLDLVSSLEQLAPLLGDMGDMGGMDTPEMSEEDMMAMTEGMTITRMEDEDGAAVFMTTLDAAALFSNPAVRDAFLSQLEAQGMTGAEAEQSEAIFDAFAENPDAFTFNLFTVIDLGTFYVRSTSFEMSMDLGTLMAATGEETEGMEEATIVMDGSLDYTAYNDVPTIEAPEGAPVVTLNELFMALSSLSAPQP